MAVLVLILSACESLSYYSQAAKGQWSVWWQRQPLDELIASSATEPELRQQLQQVQQIRRFASNQLSLPENDSYRFYTDLERPYVVWNVTAAEEFSVEPLRWCFPIAGCVSYRGYFSEQAARQYAGQLAEAGYDTYVSGVAAYSTLGWFDDPLLNTFIQRDALSLAGLIFHELAHQQLYIPGDTDFNESFATTVELVGIERWLAAKESDPGLLNAYRQHQLMQQDFIRLLLELRQQLALLYLQPLSTEAKRQRKQQILSAGLQQRYDEFQRCWPDTNVFDHWLQPPLNNARLATIASYHSWLPAFQALLDEESGNLGRFYLRVKALSQLNPEQREAILQQLSDQ